jgi:hypothetical protein
MTHNDDFDRNQADLRHPFITVHSLGH